jgi:hypothetical protein
VVELRARRASLGSESRALALRRVPSRTTIRVFLVMRSASMRPGEPPRPRSARAQHAAQVALAAAAALGLGLGLASAARAQPDAASDGPPPDQGERAAGDAEDLRGLAVDAPPGGAPEPAPAPAPPSVEVSAAAGRGVTVSLGDAFSATLRARVQIRHTLRVERIASGDRIDQLFEIRTARIWWTGHVGDRNIRYAMQLALGANDFEPGNPSPIFDVWVASTHLRDLQVRVGQFFVPFDRARTIRQVAFQTVDRSDVVRELTLDRDVGIVLQSTDLFGLGGVLSYHLGLWGGDGRNRWVTPARGAADIGLLYSARISVRPFGAFDDDQEGDIARRPEPRLAIGGGFAFNHRTDRPRSTTGAPYAHARFDYLHAAADLVFKWRGVSVLTEIVWREATRDAETYVDPETTTATTEYARNGWGYLAQLGVMLHDQVEIWARWEHLEAIRAVDPALAPGALRSGYGIGGGLNVYLNGHLLKLQADWTHSFRDDFLEGPHLIRMQLDASF